MNLFKRCACVNRAKCRHPFWYEFRLRRQHHRGSTRTANRALAQKIAIKRHVIALEQREGLHRIKPVRLSEHVKAYLGHTAKSNRTAYKDCAVLDTLITSIGDRPIDDVSPFHIERWKQERAADVSKSTVNRELNIVRGCFSRAVEWRRLAVSPLRTVKPYKVDDSRIRVLSDDELALVLTAPPDVALLCQVTLITLNRISENLQLRREHIGPSWMEVQERRPGASNRAA